MRHRPRAATRALAPPPAPPRCRRRLRLARAATRLAGHGHDHHGRRGHDHHGRRGHDHHARRGRLDPCRSAPCRHHGHGLRSAGRGRGRGRGLCRRAPCRHGRGRHGRGDPCPRRHVEAGAAHPARRCPARRHQDGRRCAGPRAHVRLRVRRRRRPSAATEQLRPSAAPLRHGRHDGEAQRRTGAAAGSPSPEGLRAATDRRRCAAPRAHAPPRVPKWFRHCHHEPRPPRALVVVARPCSETRREVRGGAKQLPAPQVPREAAVAHGAATARVASAFLAPNGATPGPGHRGPWIPMASRSRAAGASRRRAAA